MVLLLLVACADAPPPAAPTAVQPAPAQPARGGAPAGPVAPRRPSGSAPYVHREAPAPYPVPVTGPPVPGGTCMEGMVPVPAEAPRFCIDAYEAEVVDGRALSRPGVVASSGLSFDQAREVCSLTPVVDRRGKTVGFQRMALSTEWEDAADGTVGPGGQRFPFGNEPDAERCITLGPHGEERWRTPQRTGSAPGCVSPFGAYDMLGNLWEWADSGLRLSRDAWLAERAAQGVKVTIDADDRLRFAPGAVVGMDLVMNDVDRASLRADAEGHVFFPPNPTRASGAQVVSAGFLVPRGARTRTASSTLPVEVAPSVPGQPSSDWAVYWRAADEGTALPDKRGCAHYVGDVVACTCSQANLGHTRDFNGSIGFRCVSDPIAP